MSRFMPSMWRISTSRSFSNEYPLAIIPWGSDTWVLSASAGPDYFNLLETLIHPTGADFAKASYPAFVSIIHRFTHMGQVLI